MSSASGDTPGNTAGAFSPPVWHDAKGEPLSCKEKIKVLNENLEEIRELAQDALEDGILMGADEAQLRATLQALVESLDNPYRKDGEGAA